MQRSFPILHFLGLDGSLRRAASCCAATTISQRAPGAQQGSAKMLMRPALLMTLVLLTGCTTIEQMMPSYREAQRRTEQLQELQLRVMRFSDEYVGRTREVWTAFQVEATDPEDRLNAQNWKLQQADAAYTIASGSSALANALDMIVLATLSRMVIEDVWMARQDDERVRPMLETHRTLEQGAWQLIEGLSDEQTAELRQIIERWRAENPNVRAVAYIHFLDFAKSIGSPKPGKERSSGSLFAMLGLDPLSGLDPAVQEITQTRQLAERAIFYLQRAPSLLNMQVERLTYQLAVMPETKLMLEDLDRASLVGSAADQLATSLPDLLASEREALIAQLMQELNQGSDNVRALSSDVRSTLQAGTETANALHATLETVDRITARYPKAPATASADNSPPFDIRQYTEMMREVSVATRELNALAQQVDTALPAVRLATQDAAGHIEAIVDRAFLQLLVLVVVTIAASLLAALAYRAAIVRMQRSEERRRNANL